MVSEQLDNLKAGGKPMKPYISWDDVLAIKDVGAWMYTLTAATREVLSEPRADIAAIIAQGEWKDLFNTAFDLKETQDGEEGRFDYLDKLT